MPVVPYSPLDDFDSLDPLNQKEKNTQLFVLADGNRVPVISSVEDTIGSLENNKDTEAADDAENTTTNPELFKEMLEAREKGLSIALLISLPEFQIAIDILQDYLEQLEAKAKERRVGETPEQIGIRWIEYDAAKRAFDHYVSELERLASIKKPKFVPVLQ